MIEIRHAVDDDRVAIAALHVASIRRLGRARYTEEEVESWGGHLDPQRYEIDRDFFVAIDDGELAGFGVYLDGEVAAVYVHPDHIGRGIGRLLLTKLEHCGRAAGVERLVLNSSLNAQAFYERCGWRFVEVRTYATRGGIAIRCAFMEKPLR